MPKYEYMTYNVTHSERKPGESLVQTAANEMAELGWRVVAVMDVSAEDRKGGYADSLLLEREVNDNQEGQK